jgi:hypothetical protein
LSVLVIVRVQGGYKQTCGYSFSSFIMVMIRFHNQVLRVVAVRKDIHVTSRGKFSDSMLGKWYANFRGGETLVT